MKVLVEGASATFDEFRRRWTLRLSVRGPFKTNLEMGPSEWAELLPQLKGRVRHAPVNEHDAKYAERVVEDILRETPGRLAIRTSKMGVNVANWGWKERGEEKPKLEAKKMSDATDRMKLEIKCTIGRGTRTVARCRWDVTRIGQALARGLVPNSSDGAEAIIGARVLRYVEKEVEVDEVQDDGTTKTVKKKVKEPEWDEKDQPVGPFDGPFPDPKNGYAEHVAFLPEVRDLFKKGKGGKPFRLGDFDESKMELFVDPAIDMLLAQPWIDAAFERLPWVSTYKGSKPNDKVFEK